MLDLGRRSDCGPLGEPVTELIAELESELKQAKAAAARAARAK